MDRRQRKAERRAERQSQLDIKGKLDKAQSFDDLFLPKDKEQIRDFFNEVFPTCENMIIIVDKHNENGNYEYAWQSTDKNCGTNWLLDRVKQDVV